MYDFDTPRPRPAAGWAKWDGARSAGCPWDVTPFTTADMEYPAAPEIIEAVKQVADYGMWGYPGRDPAYDEAVVGWVGARHGWRPQAEWIVGTAGVVSGIYAAVRTFTKPGDGVLVQPPVYPPFFMAAEKSGRAVIENPLVNEGGVYRMDLPGLAASAKKAKLMILCSPHNPVGRVWTREELEAVLNICEENDLVLFSDEIHCDIITGERPFLSVGALGQRALARSLVAVAASKTFSLAGLGCSAVFVPNGGLRQRYQSRLAADGLSLHSTFGIAATKAAYTMGVPWMEEMLAHVGANYRLLRSFVNENWPRLRLSPMEGSYLAWLDMRALGMDGAALQEFLQKKAQLYVNPGTLFGACGEGFVRLNIACPRATLEGALQRLDAALKGL